MTATTDLSSLKTSEIFELQKKHAIKLRTQGLGLRKEKLVKLKNWIHANRPAIHKAMFDDFRKASAEVDAIEIFHVLNEIKLALGNLDRWTAPKKVDAPITMLGTRSSIHYEAKGVCLIISPWNYPFSLAVGPLVSALAAGNTAILKPSELTPNVSGVLREMVSSVFKPEEVSLFEGGPEISQRLLQLPFDHIFFTGSPAVGKVIMKTAAEHLTSVTLELGGKSPVFVAADANLDDAAERIAVAKFVNNGQTCVAPDYVFADEKIKEKLVQKIIQRTRQMFFANGQGKESPDYCRIVNDRHFNRILGLVSDAVSKGANVAWEDSHDVNSRFIHPIVITDVPAEAKILEEEIFGPVLPILSYKKIEEAIDFVNRQPKPLSLYIFSSSSDFQKNVLASTSAGGVCVNDCGVHFLHHDLPFGGVNNSGIGKSHGHYGFLAFSNEKAVLKQKSGFTTVKPFYPPYTAVKARLMDWFLKLF
jgi:aldehyde dehydrogenase (NAD+)